MVSLQEEQQLYPLKHSGLECLTFKRQVVVQFPKRSPVTGKTSKLEVLSATGRVCNQQSSLANYFRDVLLEYYCKKLCLAVGYTNHNILHYTQHARDCSHKSQDNYCSSSVLKL